MRIFLFSEIEQLCYFRVSDGPISLFSWKASKCRGFVHGGACLAEHRVRGWFLEPCVWRVFYLFSLVLADQLLCWLRWSVFCLESSWK